MDDQNGKETDFDIGRIDFHSPTNLRKFSEHLQKNLNVATAKDEWAEQANIHRNLGVMYKSQGDFQKAIEHHEKHLEIAREIGDQTGEGKACGNLGIAYRSLGDFGKAIEYHEKGLKIAIDIGDRASEGKAYGSLGIAYSSLSNFQEATEYHEKDLKIALEIGDRAGEGRAYGNIGNAYHSMGDFQKAIEYHEKHLKIALEISDKAGEGGAYGNLGSARRSLGNFREAIERHEKCLKIEIEIGNRSGEGKACGNLGNAYQSLGNFQKAIAYHEKHLSIARQIDDRAGEGEAYGNLGVAYRSIGDFHKAIEYNEKHLKTAIEIGNRVGEGGAYGNLGNAYDSMGDFRKAIEYHEKHLNIAQEIRNRAREGAAYGSLGNAYFSIGDFRKDIEYHEKHLSIARETRDRASEGKACGNIGIAYCSLGYFPRAIEYHEKHLKIAREIGDRAGEGAAYGNLGNAYRSLGDLEKAIEYHGRRLKIAIEIGDRAGQGKAYGNLANAYHSLGAFRKATECYQRDLTVAVEIGDRAGEGKAYHNIGYGYFSLGQFEKAVDNFVSAVEVFHTLRSLLKSKDGWKINFRELYETTYTGLWRSLLKIGKIEEALFAADQGRAQTLSDNLYIQYNFAPPLSATTFYSKVRISRLLAEISTSILFLAIEGLTINIWFLRREKKIAFRRGRLEGDRRDEDPICALLETAFKHIEAEVNVRCEDRSFGEHENEHPSIPEKQGENVGSLPIPHSENPFRPFYDAVIGPVVDLLEPQDEELVIVSDGALCFTPWAAVIESTRTRTIPSLTSYQLILSVPESHHKNTGALLVGNPCLDQLKKPELDLPCAQEEVEMIAAILNTRPLTGRQATKAEVMKRMSSVSLIHIAAHGNKRTGEIALSPNPGWTSNFPQRKDYILKMSDVQATNLRARLVVLSCCHSGRGRILKGEGVVGIARAFLAAGARSVLVTLWAIDDEATMVFMTSFYQHLKKGKTTSAAVQQSMKSLRESEEHSEIRYWAPFQLIGDDVRIEFEADDHIK